MLQIFRTEKFWMYIKNVQVYAIVRIYQALGKKNGTLYTAAENMKEYEYTVIADDSEFEKTANMQLQDSD